MRKHRGMLTRDTKQSPVRAARLRAGLTREKAAVKVGLSFATVALAERGMITERTAKRLARLYGVRVEELLPAATVNNP